MLLTKFAEDRNVKIETIRRYISRHETQFEGHIKSKGVKQEIDEVALALLDEVYPNPHPIHIIQGVPQEEHNILLAKYEALLEKYSLNQEQLADVKEQISMLEGKQLLLEEKDNRINDIKEMLEHSQTELEKEKEKLEKTSEELERLKNRGLWDRITNKM